MDEKPDVVYICDGKACGNECSHPVCHLTNDIKHAKNFMYVGDNKYVEMTDDDQVSIFCDRVKDHEIKIRGGYKSVEYIVKSMNDDQKRCLDWIIKAALVDSYKE